MPWTVIFVSKNGTPFWWAYCMIIYWKHKGLLGSPTLAKLAPYHGLVAQGLLLTIACLTWLRNTADQCWPLLTTKWQWSCHFWLVPWLWVTIPPNFRAEKALRISVWLTDVWATPSFLLCLSVSFEPLLDAGTQYWMCMSLVRSHFATSSVLCMKFGVKLVDPAIFVCPHRL